jgi:hypothetical protein
VVRRHRDDSQVPANSRTALREVTDQVRRTARLAN